MTGELAVILPSALCPLPSAFCLLLRPSPIPAATPYFAAVAAPGLVSLIRSGAPSTKVTGMVQT